METALPGPVAGSSTDRNRRSTRATRSLLHVWREQAALCTAPGGRGVQRAWREPGGEGRGPSVSRSGGPDGGDGRGTE